MKNIEALKNITEVSKELNIEKLVIRFWETIFKDLKPIQKTNGSRYYSLDNILYKKDLNIKNMVLISRTRKKIIGLDGFGLKIRKQIIIK